MKVGATDIAPIGALLIQNRKLTDQQLQTALEEQRDSPGERLGEVLLRLGYVNEEDLCECLAHQYSLPMVRLNRYLVDHSIFDAFPQRFLEKNQVCPMFKVGDTTTVAITDPTNIFVLDEIRRLVGGKVQAVISTPKNILEAIRNKVSVTDAFGIDDNSESIDDHNVQIVEEKGSSRRTWPRSAASPRSSATSTTSSSSRSRRAPRTSTSRSTRTSCGCAIGSTACSATSTSRRPGRCTRRSCRGSRSWPTSTSRSDACRRTVGSG